MSSATDYGRAGRFGLLTPQSNPTVEPEFRRLMPPDTECYVARLTSASTDPRARLVEYIERLADTLRQFDTLRLGAVGFACTGSTYLIGAQREQEILRAAAAQSGTQIETAAGAIRAALGHLAARRLLVVSPYPAWLRDAALAYWRAAGLEVVGAVDVPTGRADTRGIYDLQSDDARRVLLHADAAGADVVLLSGTGMPSLPLLRAGSAAHPPVVSSNQCLAWRMKHHAIGWQPRAGTLLDG